MDNRWLTQPVFYNHNISMKNIKTKNKKIHLVPGELGLTNAMCTTRLCDLYINGTFKSKAEIASLNKKPIIEQSYHSLKLIIKDLIGPGKPYEGIPKLLKDPAKHSVSSVLELMTKVKKGSGEYRKIIATSVKRKDIHSPGSWRQKLQDNSITSLQVKGALRSTHSKYLTPGAREILSRFYHGKTLFGNQLLRAGIVEDGICRSCKKENKKSVPESLLHATYECSTVEYIYRQILYEFELQSENLPLNSGSVVLSTVLDSTKGARLNLSELINLVWSMALDGVLSARNAKLTPRADIIITNIKHSLLSVVKYKPKSNI